MFNFLMRFTNSGKISAATAKSQTSPVVPLITSRWNKKN